MPSLTGHSTKMTKVVNDYGNLFSTLKAAYEHSFKGIVSRESYDVVWSVALGLNYGPRTTVVVFAILWQRD